jgi:hypothetical protein
MTIEAQTRVLGVPLPKRKRAVQPGKEFTISISRNILRGKQPLRGEKLRYFYRVDSKGAIEYGYQELWNGRVESELVLKRFPGLNINGEDKSGCVIRRRLLGTTILSTTLVWKPDQSPSRPQT